MPQNRNALVRYHTIDSCLRDNSRQWDLESLIEACTLALFQTEGSHTPISRRTVQLDIENMRGPKLGYNAPIEVYNRKYYRYSDPDYSITNIALSTKDIEQMSNAVTLIKQLSGFASVPDIEDIIDRLECHVTSISHKKKPTIYFEKNDSLKGLCFIQRLQKAISASDPVLMTYRSFSAEAPKQYILSPYILKEYRNRWFIVGRTQEKPFRISTFALDRMLTIDSAPDSEFIEDPDFDHDRYFKDVIGVTVISDRPTEKIVFRAKEEQAKYIETKHMHSSQATLSHNEDGTVDFQIEVIPNFELFKELLAFGDNIKVLLPPHIAQELANRIKRALAQYE